VERGVGVVSADPGALMARIARGDQRAFAELYDALAPTLYGIVLRVVRDPAQSEEVTQEAFVELWRQAARFDSARGGVRGWAVMIAHRRAVDRVRSEQSRRDRQSRHVVAPGDAPDSPADAVIESLDRDRAVAHWPSWERPNDKRSNLPTSTVSPASRSQNSSEFHSELRRRE
jgi:RNA polymerase sigma factor (sigma-70 family)